MLSYLVNQRQQEIGVRMALGAGGGSVLAMILRRGLALACVGLGLGLVGALIVSRLLASLLFGVRPTDPVTLAACCS